MNVVRYADRPDLRERRGELNGFPEYMLHNAMGSKYWGRLYDEFPAFQLALDDGGELVAEVHALPVHVDAELPAGWDDAFERGMELGDGNVLCLLAIAVQPQRRGGGIAATLIQAARRAAADEGLAAVIALVRPTLKSSYPLIPIEQYIEWRRDDGSHLNRSV
jgi:GNAT superfamily N-acetyltransferase